MNCKAEFHNMHIYVILVLALVFMCTGMEKVSSAAAPSSIVTIKSTSGILSGGELGYPRWKMAFDKRDSTNATIDLIAGTNAGDSAWRTTNFGNTWTGLGARNLNYHANLSVDDSGVMHVGSRTGDSGSATYERFNGSWSPVTLWNDYSGQGGTAHVLAYGSDLWAFVRSNFGAAPFNITWRRSTNGSTSWTSPAVVKSPNDPVWHRIGSAIVNAAPACVIWDTYNSYTQIEIYRWNGTIFAPIANNNLRTASSNALTRQFSVVTAGDGGIHAVWWDDLGSGHYAMRHSHRSYAGTWSTPVTVDGTTMDISGDTGGPILTTVEGSTKVWIFYVGRVAGHLAILSSVWDGTSWLATMQISNSASGEAEGPNTVPMVPANAGYIPVAWTQGTTPALYYTTLDTGISSSPPELASLSLLPASVVGGSPSQGTVTLSGPALIGGAVVSLMSADLLTATVPLVVTVPLGSSSSTFPISTNPVSNASAVSISASYGSALSQNALLTVTPPISLSIATTTLPSGTLGTVYNQTLTAIGGHTPYTWSIASGSLPAGLTLNSDTGTISGTPTTTGASAFTVSVQDASQVIANTNQILNIIPTELTLAIDATVANDSSSTGTAITSPALTTNATNELLLAFISGSSLGTGVNTTVTGVANTGGALTWTRAVINNGQQGTAEIWWAYATTPLSGTVTATMSQSVSSRSITVMSLTGTAGGADAIGAIGSGNAAAAPPSASLVTTRANSWVFGTGNDWAESISRTLGPGQTMVHQFLSPLTGDTYWVQRQTNTTPVAGTTVTINDTTPINHKYNLSIVEIRTASAPPVLASLSLLPASVVGGSSSQGTVILSGPAPGGGAVVSLTSADQSTVTVPLTVTVPVGSSSVTFPISSNQVSTTTMVSITASYGSTPPQTAILTVAIPLTLSITTSILPSGTVGAAYSQTLTATGGLTPYAWSMASGSLPIGLTLDQVTGKISGTPISAGTITVAFQVSDRTAVTATKNLNLTIVLAQILTINTTVSNDSSSTGTTITTPTLTTNSANELLVAFISGSSPGTGANTRVTGVTNIGGALTWTRAVITNGQQGTAEIWWAYATKPLSGSVTATMSKSVSSRSITVMSFTGAASGTAAIGATGSHSSATGAPTASLVTTRANSWVFGTGNDWAGAISRTVGPGQAMVHQFLSASTGDTYWVQRQTSSTPLTGTTVTMNDTAPSGHMYNLSIVEIRTP
ncbi:MAG: putative Ig domain-containing protein [Desulfuromonadales bacterium]|nr:putative Ig domain-containing protein [Desulfuromonadales bacterium]